MIQAICENCGEMFDLDPLKPNKFCKKCMSKVWWS